MILGHKVGYMVTLYGNKDMHTPGLDELAKQGVTFTNAYSNVPVCGASRASVMTGLRPSISRFSHVRSRMDEDAPNIPTLVKHFKNNGYQRHSLGKVFHNSKDSASSWTEKPWNPIQTAGKTTWRNYILPVNLAQDIDPNTKRPLSYEEADVSDDAYFDGKIQTQCERSAIHYRMAR